jgi:hypothetical protein
MYYTSTDRETLDAYNEKVVAGENYDGNKTVRWADVIEHHEGGQFAILKHPSYPLIDGLDDNDEPLDAPTVDSISDFFPPLEELN